MKVVWKKSHCELWNPYRECQGSLPPNRRVLYEKLTTERWINHKYMQAWDDAHSFGA